MSSANATRVAPNADVPDMFHHADPAARVIEGEKVAGDFLNRVSAGMAECDELAVLASMLYGETLRGFCRALEKALRVHHA